MHGMESRIVYHLKFLSIILIKNGRPTASAVHNKGVIINRIGSFVELQLIALKPPTGISHNRAKFAKSTLSEKPLKIRRIK